MKLVNCGCVLSIVSHAGGSAAMLECAGGQQFCHRRPVICHLLYTGLYRSEPSSNGNRNCNHNLFIKCISLGSKALQKVGKGTWHLLPATEHFDKAASERDV